MKRIYRMIALFMALMLTACGEPIQINEIITEDKEPVLGMLEEAEILYEIPKIIPNIHVDLLGYEPKSRKVAVLVAAELPQFFSVIDAETGALMYSGKVTVEDIRSTDELKTGYADFTDLQKEGQYYIKTDLLGYSKEFQLKEGIYDSLLTEALTEIHNRRCGDPNVQVCHTEPIPFEEDTTATKDVSGGWHTGTLDQKDVVEGCLTALDLMLAYEFHPGAFDDETGIVESENGIPDILDEIKYEIDWLFKMQNLQSGGVYTSVTAHESSDGSISYLLGGETTKATAYFCTTLAKFSYIINKYDKAYATKCLKVAGMAWQCIELNKELMVGEQRYRAAVEMYRATGYTTYGNAILNYLETNAAKEYESRITIDAAITYLSTPKWVDRNYCTLLMQNLMSRTEEKSNASKNARYLVVTEDTDDNIILRNAVELVVVDYIISNQEYAIIEENYLHYFLGRNETSEIRKQMTESPDMYAQFIVLMSKIVDSKKASDKK